LAIPLIGLGAGGHARVVLDVLGFLPQYEVKGLLDPNPALAGQTWQGIPILGGDDLLPVLKAQGIGHFFVGVGSVADLRPRRKLYEMACTAGLEPAMIVHPGAYVSAAAVVGRGATVMVRTVINSGACLGENVIVNTSATIEHDCSIGAHAHIATGAVLAGGVTVGEGTHVGVGAVVRQGICIGAGCVVGAGAVVVKDVADGMVVVGNPAHPLVKNTLVS